MNSQEEFLSLFPDTRFRYIHDVSKETIQGNNILDMSWNKKGYGIFFTANSFPATGKADLSQIISLNANYVDFDVDPSLSQEDKDKLIQEVIMSGLEMGIPSPTIINRTQKGAHLIWLYVNKIEPTPENIEKWRSVQKRLVYCFKGDRNVIDPTRVLRLPFTLHLKDPKNPFEVRVISYKPDSKYTIEELDALLPHQTSDEISKEKATALELLLKGVPVGKGLRHEALAQVAGLLLRNADTPEKVEIARLNYYEWDKKVVGSPERFEERKIELDNTFESILKKESVNNTFILPDKLHLWSVGEILKHDFGEEDWLVESLIPKQGMEAVSGNPGDFKTWVTIHKAICVARGEPVFGKFKVAQGDVLIIDEEDHLRLLKKRLELLGAKETDNIYYLSQNGIKMDVPEVRDEILKIVKEKNIKLLILDSLVRVHGQDENDAKGMAKVFSSLQKIITAGASILFTHHHRKQSGLIKINPGQSMRGSSDILAAVDSHITVEKKQDENRLIIRQTKLRQAELLPPFEISILMGESGPSGFEYAGDHNDKKEKAIEASETVVMLLADGIKCRTEIQEALSDEFGKTAIDDGIKLAEENEEIERVPKEELAKDQRKKAHYRIANTSTCSPIIPENELPISQPHIEARKQEVINDPFDFSGRGDFFDPDSRGRF